VKTSSDEPIIRIENLCFAYNADSENPVVALKDINLEINRGEYIAIIGHNGSGKTTLAKHLNALLIPTKGDVWVKGMNTRDPSCLREIRSTVGMVFQNPDNQLVATIVEEDVAFGPENLGLPPEEIRERVDWALEIVGMLPFRNYAPHLLSAGQKQKVALAGAMAMKPECLILDESTTYLDPAGRREVLDVVRRLNEEGITVITITHFMEEAVQADRVLVLEKGRIAVQGTPRQVFRWVERLRALQLDVPQVTELAWRLHKRSSNFPADLLTVEEMVEELCQRIGRRTHYL